jgi:hypothetical protein
MDKFDFSYADGSTFIMAEEDNDESNMEYYRGYYFEVEITLAGNMCIELKSSSGALLYDGLFGDLLHLSTKAVFPGVPFSDSSVVGIHVWSIKTDDKNVKSMVRFL